MDRFADIHSEPGATPLRREARYRIVTDSRANAKTCCWKARPSPCPPKVRSTPPPCPRRGSTTAAIRRPSRWASNALKRAAAISRAKPAQSKPGVCGV